MISIRSSRFILLAIVLHNACAIGKSISSHPANATVVNFQDSARQLSSSKDLVTGRACAGCTGATCNTNAQVSLLPVIQIMISMVSGVVWAGILIWVYKNFFQHEKKHGHHKPSSQSQGWGWEAAPEPAPAPMGWGSPSPQYGAPMSEYGSPSSTKYGPPKGRAVNEGFDILTQRVTDAVKRFS